MQEMQEIQVQSLGWEDPLEKVMATTPVFVPGESHGQRSLVGHSPQGHTQLDTTEANEHACTSKVMTYIGKVFLCPNTSYLKITSVWGGESLGENGYTYMYG